MREAVEGTFFICFSVTLFFIVCSNLFALCFAGVLGIFWHATLVCQRLRCRQKAGAVVEDQGRGAQGRRVDEALFQLPRFHFNKMQACGENASKRVGCLVQSLRQLTTCIYGDKTQQCGWGPAAHITTPASKQRAAAMFNNACTRVGRWCWVGGRRCVILLLLILNAYPNPNA